MRGENRNYANTPTKKLANERRLPRTANNWRQRRKRPKIGLANYAVKAIPLTNIHILPATSH
jgi:hypothetical protein